MKDIFFFWFPNFAIKRAYEHDVTSVQSIFIVLSLTKNVCAFNFLQCGLGAKKPDVICIEGRRLFKVKNSH